MSQEQDDEQNQDENKSQGDEQNQDENKKQSDNKSKEQSKWAKRDALLKRPRNPSLGSDLKKREDKPNRQ